MADQFKKLKIALDTPESISSESLKELKQLKQICASINLPYSSNSSTQVVCNSSDIPFSLHEKHVDSKKINALNEMINRLIFEKINTIQIKYCSLALLLHLALFFWIFLYRKMEILPWYLVVGSSVLMLVIMLLPPHMKGVHGLSLYYWLSCRYLIYACIPLCSMLITILLFVSPGSLNLLKKELAVVLHDTDLSIGCGKNVFLENILKRDQIVVVEAVQGVCARVHDVNTGIAGYLPLATIKMINRNTMDQLKKRIIYLTEWTLLVCLVVCFLSRIYYTRVIPMLLRKLAEKNKQLLQNQLEATKLLTDFHQESMVLTALDLQESRTDLIVKITKRYQVDVDAIMSMKNLSEVDKKSMLAKLLNYYSASLKCHS